MGAAAEKEGSHPEAEIKNLKDKSGFMFLYSKAKTLAKTGEKPLQLAKNMGISVIFLPFASVAGMAMCVQREKMIFINSNLSEMEQQFVCGHELGHFHLHPSTNFIFILRNTLFQSKHEYQANRFACELMLGEKTEEYKHLISELCSKGRLDKLAEFISFALNSEQGDDP
jgi:Zn-dependent peptidase ImmA (M78 family)